MPELPEVETIVRSLAPRLRGRTIGRAEFIAARVLRGGAVPEIEGRRVTEVERHGKYILLRFENGTLAIHLGMTGKLLLDGESTPYLRAWLEFTDGGRLLFDDIRQFGRMAWAGTLPAGVARLGPDALEISAESFFDSLRRRNARLKPLLLNQSFIRGLGNIYVDEALFRAGIHPLAIARRISAPRAGLLHGAMQEVLSEAIERGGSSISDYVDADGNRGSFQQQHRVYGREGEPCVHCGKAIRRIVVGQRGTHFCPRCQRK